MASNATNKGHIDAHANAEPDERVYRPSRKWSWLMVVSGGFLLSLGLALAACAWFGVGDAAESVFTSIFFYLLALVFGGCGVACLIFTAQFRLHLAGDQIRVREFFKYHTVRQGELRGTRVLPTSPPYVVLATRDRSVRRIKISMCFDADELFWDWLDGLPDLDAADQVNAEGEILRTDAFGATEARRWARFQQAVRVARWPNALALLTLVWGLFYPRPYEMAMAVTVLTPWLAIETLRRHKGLIRLDGPTNDVYPSIGAALILPGMVLSMRVLLDWQIVNWVPGLVGGFGIATLMLFILLQLDLEARRRALASSLLFLFLIPYGYSALTLASCLWGNQEIEQFTARVVSKRVASRSSGPDYLLEVKPWGHRSEVNEVSAVRSLYDQLTVGDQACIAVRPGALSIAWFTVWPCRE